jgi:O-antigen ligase
MFIWFFSSIQRKNQRLGIIGIALFGLLGVAVVTDRLFWERMLTISEAASLVRVEEQETGGTRILFWKAAIDMAKDHPFGAGSSAFIYYSPFYLPENINTGRSRNRAVHSTWFEVLTEIGYLGLAAFSFMIYFSFLTCYRAAKRLKEQNNAERYFKVVAIGCALLCFVVSMTFLNRLRAEMLYWCVLFTAIAYNIYVLKDPTKQITSKQPNKTKLV